jgi:hypothetical protein
LSSTHKIVFFGLIVFLNISFQFAGTRQAFTPTASGNGPISAGSNGCAVTGINTGLPLQSPIRLVTAGRHPVTARILARPVSIRLSELMADSCVL